MIGDLRPRSAAPRVSAALRLWDIWEDIFSDLGTTIFDSVHLSQSKRSSDAVSSSDPVGHRVQDLQIPCNRTICFLSVNLSAVKANRESQNIYL